MEEIITKGYTGAKLNNFNHRKINTKSYQFIINTEE